MDDLLDEKNREKSLKKKAKNLIQLERTRTAFERLQLAWIRTSLTIMAVGIGVYEFFFNRLESGKTPLFETFTGRELALVLYCISFTVLNLSLNQHRKSMATLKESYPESRYSVAGFLSILLIVLAIILISILLWNAFNH